MDIDFLRNLNVRQVFVGVGLESLLTNLETEESFYAAVFDETMRHVIFVTDDPQLKHCVYIQETKGADTNKLLTVNNSSQKPLYLWRIDGVMFSKFSKCDCALFQDKKLRFVEFKANAISEFQGTIQANCEKASEQLSLTYKMFGEKYSEAGKSLKDLFNDIEAVIVLNKTIPRDDAYHKKLKATFVKQNRIKLNIENVISI